METMQKSYTLGDEDKATPVMIYTDNSLLVGEVVTKKVLGLFKAVQRQTLDPFGVRGENRPKEN